MNGLGGLNKSANGVVVGMVQLQLPVVETPEDLARQTGRVCELVGKARRNLDGMDLVVFPEYALHGLSMNMDPAIMCRIDGPEVAALQAACAEHAIWGCFSIMEHNPAGNPYNTGLIIDDEGALRLHYRKLHPWVPVEPWEPGNLGIPVIEVVKPPEGYAPSREEQETFDRAHDAGLQAVGFTGVPFAGEGTAVNSGEYNGLSTAEFKQRITADLAARGLGREAVNYRLRDWLFSRQHFWGEPFPIWHELDADSHPTGLMRAESPGELPVRLPEDFEFKPHGRPEPPLEEAPESWLYKTADDGVRLKRETNSMPQWAGSCWYYLRFCDPQNEHRFVDPDVEKYWMPVDLYIGGAEHAVLHLLYARFWHKLLFDRGHVSTPEPFQRLVNQGMILGENNEKMSKSRGNVVNPDDVVADYGADALRLYEMFMGPLEQVKPWSMKGVEGVYRFLGRVWRMFIDERREDVALSPAVQDVPPTADQERLLHKTIKAVTEDIEKLSLNTAISRMMEFCNELTGNEVRPRAALKPFVLLLSPFAPHLAEELWSVLGHPESLAYEPWPTWDESKLVTDEIELPVQISGKVRARILVPAAADAQAVEQLALNHETVQKQLAGKTVQKVIVVPGRMVNIVAS